jgi:hypothetical protein
VQFEQIRMGVFSVVYYGVEFGVWSVALGFNASCLVARLMEVVCSQCPHANCSHGTVAQENQNHSPNHIEFEHTYKRNTACSAFDWFLARRHASLCCSTQLEWRGPNVARVPH